ncbi:acyltransferase [Flavobacterium crocinum]|uniref:Acyltransferase n=1 Tax=Flavobacterium crocinum TaxID=2183896 RepID=A0A2S1YTA1_9FLAO|nr:acyltransferase [Flavobacterium crocinum]AWK07243.1 acyltransferase [Flavobacterium crocinum]
MRKIINKVVSNLKGEEFQLDPKIPLSYLFHFFTIKFFSLLYGVGVTRKFKKVFIHPSSTVVCSSKIKFGENFLVGRNCYVNALSEEGLICGDNVSMGFHTHIDLTGSLKNLAKGIKIGNNVGLGSHGHYGSGVGGLEIGDDTIIGNYVSFHPENHNFSDLTVPIRLQGVSGKGIIIGENCWIGTKATFLDGAEIGNGCVVAAGAVVKDKFPDNVIIGGVPAKILKYRTAL